VSLGQNANIAPAVEVAVDGHAPGIDREGYRDPAFEADDSRAGRDVVARACSEKWEPVFGKNTR
jgi:hypothetical protein